MRTVLSTLGGHTVEIELENEAVNAVTSIGRSGRVRTFVHVPVRDVHSYALFQETTAEVYSGPLPE